jgi:hypothetical protein
MPDTMKNISADRTKPNRTGAKRGGISVSMIVAGQQIDHHRTLQKTHGYHLIPALNAMPQGNLPCLI